MHLSSRLFLNQSTSIVIPAQAGIHYDFKSVRPVKSWAHNWIPAPCFKMLGKPNTVGMTA